jgi:hypothetical protein
MINLEQLYLCFFPNLGGLRKIRKVLMEKLAFTFF